MSTAQMVMYDDDFKQLNYVLEKQSDIRYTSFGNPADGGS